MIQNKVWEAKSKAGIDVHLSDDEAKEFQAVAKLIDPDRYFTIYGCQECINTLVKFVFENQVEELEERVSWARRNMTIEIPVPAKKDIINSETFE